MKLSDFNYNLPKELIAQTPIEGRSGSKMMTVDSSGKIEHKKFTDFIDYLNPDDVLVLNDTRVIPARLLGKRASGANIEIFLLKSLNEDLCSCGCQVSSTCHPASPLNSYGLCPPHTAHAFWSALIKNSRRLKQEEIIPISPELSVKIIEKAHTQDNTHIVELLFDTAKNIYEILDNVGKIPLPPYITRSAEQKDKEVYQTVFASQPGSVAAPTAGLHFTKEILEKIQNKGVKIAYINLLVGLGTFMPVKTENILEHKMHFESFNIPPETADLINNAKGDIIAVGTTVVRTLEATCQKHGKIIAANDETNIFIYPPYEFKVVNKLLTNFHLPKSTLIMLVSAFSGKENIFKAYESAIENKYRFFSYGDCMFLKK